MGKKILLLGGSIHQLPAIEYANNKGYYTILCDYLADNPGQSLAKKFYCVSTTDLEAVIEVAKREKINGIVAYASDPAAPTAAYIAETLGLPTNPFKSVEILSYKDMFRAFLIENGFNCPKAKSFSSYSDAIEEIKKFKLPVMVKPNDSSGSKGISIVASMKNFAEAYYKAVSYSRSKKIIVEEFIDQDHPYMIAGDCFVIDGRVEFWGFLNSHRNKNVNPFVPVGTSYPIFISKMRLIKIKRECQKLFNLLNIRFGAFNIEILIDKNDKLYFIEMGPRNGGNMIPDLLLMATEENLIAATIDSAMGEKYIFKHLVHKTNFLTTYVLHSNQDGIIKEILFKNNIESKIIKRIIYKEAGDKVQYFDGANKAIGILFLKFDSQEEQLNFMDNPEKYCEVILI